MNNTEKASVIFSMFVIGLVILSAIAGIFTFFFLFLLPFILMFMLFYISFSVIFQLMRDGIEVNSEFNTGRGSEPSTDEKLKQLKIAYKKGYISEEKFEEKVDNIIKEDNVKQDSIKERNKERQIN